jgi:ABC-2 type transport system permease protein
MRIAIAACVRRDLTIARSYRLAFALEAVAIVAGLAIFAGVAKVVDATSVAHQTGVPGGYLAFASVGIAVTGIFNVYCAAFARRVREDQTTGAFEAMLTTPTSPRVLVIAGAAYDLARALVLATVTVFAAVVIFGVDLHLQGASALSIFVALPGLMATLAAVGIVVASVGVVFKDPGPVVALATAGIALLSGAYFPIAVLPAPLDEIAKLVPFTWGLETLRAGLLGGHVEVWKCVGLAVIGAIALPYSLRVFERAVDAARAKGSLGQY